MTRAVLYLILCLSAFGISAELKSEISIIGEAPGFENEEIFLLEYQEFLLGSYEILGQTTVDSTGVFTFEFEVSEDIGYLGLECGQVRSNLYVQDGQVYKLLFEEPASGRIGSFGKPALSELIFFDLDSTDINWNIIDFNLMYEDFFRANYSTLESLSASGSGKGDTTYVAPQQKARLMQRLFTAFQDFEESMDEKYTSIDSPFFQDYRKGVMGQMMMNNLTTDRKEIFDRYIKECRYHHKNPEASSLHQRFFADYLTQSNSATYGKSGWQSISNKGWFDEIMNILKEDAFVVGEDKRISIMTSILIDAWTDERIDRREIIDGLERLDSAENSIAAIIKKRLEKQLAGHDLHKWSLPDEAGEQRILGELSSNAIVVEFWAGWCTRCSKQHRLLETLASEQPFSIYAVNMDNDMPSFKASLGQRIPNEKRIDVFAGNNPEMKQDYNIASLPVYMLLDSQGKRVSDGYRYSVEELEPELMRLMKETNPSERPRVGSKEN